MNSNSQQGTRCVTSFVPLASTSAFELHEVFLGISSWCLCLDDHPRKLESAFYFDFRKNCPQCNKSSQAISATEAKPQHAFDRLANLLQKLDILQLIDWIVPGNASSTVSIGGKEYQLSLIHI